MDLLGGGVRKGEGMSLVNDQQFPTQKPQRALSNQDWDEVKKQVFESRIHEELGAIEDSHLWSRITY